MSFSSSRKRALDTSRPIAYRASSARSCAVCVSEKYRVKRSVILEQVRQKPMLISTLLIIQMAS
ncbi:hypothetical protein [Shewanella sp. KT0246]|uniref:hypothetical protein n=1 Tax=Shewanella sp. KT0246 TaxID=2815912 RepID=UPI001C7CB10F|nr:hypothetical protein [Shewanella sp. KT0246]